MAKLKNKKETPEVQEVLENTVVSEPEELVTPEQLIEDEVANTTVLDKATDLVSEIFGLDKNYSVTKFESKGQRVKLELENRDFIVNVTIKDRCLYGLFNENDELV